MNNNIFLVIYWSGIALGYAWNCCLCGSLSAPLPE